MPWNHKRFEGLTHRAEVAPYQFHRTKVTSAPNRVVLHLRDQTDAYFLQLSAITTHSSTRPKPIYDRYLRASKTSSRPRPSAPGLDLYRDLWGDSREDEAIHEVEGVLNTIYQASQENKVRSALMHLFRFVDAKLNQSDFRTCDALLEKAALERLPPELLVGLMRITFPARDQLARWQKTFERVEEKLQASDHDPKRLLVGLFRAE